VIFRVENLEQGTMCNKYTYTICIEINYMKCNGHFLEVNYTVLICQEGSSYLWDSTVHASKQSVQVGKGS